MTPLLDRDAPVTAYFGPDPRGAWPTLRIALQASARLARRHRIGLALRDDAGTLLAIVVPPDDPILAAHR